MPFCTSHSWRVDQIRHFIGSVLTFAHFVTVSNIRNEPHDSGCTFPVYQRSISYSSRQYRTDEQRVKPGDF